MTKRKAELPDLTRTARAVEALDAEYAKPDSEIDWSKIIELDREVGRAFGEDTADRNNQRTCEQCVRAGRPSPGPGFELAPVRRWVEQWKKKKRSTNTSSEQGGEGGRTNRGKDGPGRSGEGEAKRVVWSTPER